MREKFQSIITNENRVQYFVLNEKLLNFDHYFERF
jgi:hypothetical protein